MQLYLYCLLSLKRISFFGFRVIALVLISGTIFQVNTSLAAIHVVSVYPANHSVTAQINSDIVIDFDNPILLTSSCIQVFGSVTGMHAGSTTLDNSNQRVIFHPYADFVFGETVQIVLTENITSSSDGSKLLGGYSWKYHTKTQYGTGKYTISSTSIPAGNTPSAIASGDFNRDGFPDLAVTHSGGNNIGVFLNNHHGSFLPPIFYSVGSKPVALCAADLDNNGYPDIIAANKNSGNISVLINNGQGSFYSLANYITSSNPTAVSSADIDNDGDLDVAVANSGDSTITLLKNNGYGFLSYAQTIFLPAAPSSVITEDLNCDGAIDGIVALNGVKNAADSIYITLLKNSSGVFSNDITYAIPYYGSKAVINAITAFDYDKDGYPDIAVANGESYEVSIFLNDKYGRLVIDQYVFDAGSLFQRTTLSLYGNDLNADGSMDLSVANLRSKFVRNFLNRGASTYPDTQSVGMANGPQGIAGLDISGRFGAIDLVTANSATNNLTFLRNQNDARPSGSITLSSTVFNSLEAALGDTARATLKVYSDFISNTIDSIRFSSPLFISNGSYPVNLNAYDSTAIEIWYIPKSLGSISGSLNIFTTDGIRTVDLNAASLAPAISVNTSLLDFGTIQIGHTDVRNLKITNTSANPLLIDSLVLQWKGFALPNLIFPVSIRKGDTLQVPITFSPTILQDYYDTVRIYSNSNPSEIKVALKGLGGPVGVFRHDNTVPKEYSLDQNYPNPFNPTTSIGYQLSAISDVTLKIYDISGREIAVLVDGEQNLGVYTVVWNAQNISSGVYLYTLTARPRGGETGRMFTMTKKLLLLR